MTREEFEKAMSALEEKLEEHWYSSSFEEDVAIVYSFLNAQDARIAELEKERDEFYDALVTQTRRTHQAEACMKAYQERITQLKALLEKAGSVGWKAMYEGREQAVTEFREENAALRSRIESAPKGWCVEYPNGKYHTDGYAVKVYENWTDAATTSQSAADRDWPSRVVEVRIVAVPVEEKE